MRYWFSGMCQLVLGVACLPLCAQTRPPTLTTIGAVRALGSRDAAKGLPVLVRGIITYNNFREQTIFVQDATGFIYVQADRAYPFLPGTQVEISGTTASSYTPQIESVSIRELSRGKLPPSVFLDYQSATRHENDCRYVSMQGIVRSATLQTTSNSRIYLLQLEVDGRLMDVAVTDYRNFNPEQLLDATVRVTGVLGGIFDVSDQIIGLELNVSDADGVTMVKPAAPDQSSTDSEPLTALLRSGGALRPTHRVFTTGIVTLYDPGELLVIQDDDSRLFIQTRQMDPVSIGQRVEVTGFLAAVNGSPALQLGQFSPIGGSTPLSPQRITFGDAMSGKFGNDLVALEGEVISQTHERHLDTIILRSSGRLFQAVFRKPTGDPDPIPLLQPGTRIRATGVCIVHVRGFWGGVESFQIHLRNPRDVAILAPASWWTVDHLFVLTSALSGITLVALLWGLWMRRRLFLHEKLLRQNLQSEAAHLAILARLEQQRSHILELINGFQPLPIVLTAIQAYADEMWPGTVGYSHVLQDRKLVLMGHSHLSVADIARLEIVDPADGVEVCAQAVRTRNLITSAESRHVWSRPVMSKRGEILGTITFEGRANSTLTINTEAFEFACNLAAIAIDNRRLYEDVVHRSEHDHLTGLPNRSLLKARMEEALGRARETQCFAAVLYIDLDDFKSVNDTYTHRMGDLYLIEVARRFKVCLRDCDTLSRIGGDEFIAVLADLSNPDQARTVAARLVETMQTPVLIESNTISRSVSVGVAVFPLPSSDAGDVAHLADRAMYAAKRNGGNRFSLAESILIST